MRTETRKLSVTEKEIQASVRVMSNISKIDLNRLSLNYLLIYFGGFHFRKSSIALCYHNKSFSYNRKFHE